MRLRALEIENSDEAVAQKKRHDEFGTRLHAGLTVDVARILRNVIDPEAAALTRGRSGEPLVQGDAQARGNGIAAAHGEYAFQMLGLLVPEHDAENVILDDFLDALRDAAEELFAVKDRCDLAADFVEQSESLGLFRVRKEQALGNGIGVTQ